jgi:hypothetical protein
VSVHADVASMSVSGLPEREVVATLQESARSLLL